MNLAAVMQAVADRLTTISGLRCFAYPEAQLSPPGAVVLYPESIRFDEAYQRGMDRMRLPVLVVVGKVSDRSARDQLAAYCDGSGAASVKQVLESGTYTAFDVVTVVDVEFDVATLAGTDYLAANFTLDIAGKGTS
jgi:hypothetical protein